MNQTMRVVLLTLILILNGCGGGGGGSSTSTTVTPYPYQTSGTYQGVPYSELGDPPGFSNYPTAYFPTFMANNAMAISKIAYGRDEQLNISNLTAYITMGKHICSATPVYYNALLDSTFLVGAAHCFVANKTMSNNLLAINLVDVATVTIYNGLNSQVGWIESIPATAVYVMRNYCYGATFDTLGGCPNFGPDQGVANGQGNDLAIIQINGQYADIESYPQVVPESEYPSQLSMAPVLSIGYGLYTQQPASPDNNLPKSSMFYVANYFYMQSDATGYYYLFSSFYNSVSNGYAALICGGDSGGGDLFWTGSKWILLAEHTYGPSDACGTYYSSLPNAATNVGAYYAWIESIIQAPDPFSWCNSLASNCVTNAK